MIQIQTTVQGLDQLTKNLNALRKNVGKAIADAHFKAGKQVEGSAIRSIQTVSPGREVKREREGGAEYFHIAAQRGFTPNTDTGRLVASIQTEVKPDKVFVGSALEYSRRLEFDGWAWLVPALESEKDAISKIFTKAIGGAL